MASFRPADHVAIVSRRDPFSASRPRYLQLSDTGASDWTDDLRAATSFGSMREATRAAVRLPAALRAFSLPKPAETLRLGSSPA